MRKRLYDTGDFKIYYSDNGKEDEIDLYHSLVRFIAIGVTIAITIGFIMFQLL